MQEDNSNDPLLTNKIAAAVLAALLLIFGLPQLSAALTGGGHHGGGHEELHLAYCCVELETKTTPVDDKPVFDLGTALLAASPERGARRAALCKSCHTFEAGGANGTGPNLYNMVNRPLASVAGFNYTNAVQEAGGVWSYERLNEYLKNSQAYIPGTAMVQRFPKDDQRADLLAYLGSLSPNPAAFPAPTIIEEIVDAATNSANDVADAAGDGAEKIGNIIDEAKDAISDDH